MAVVRVALTGGVYLDQTIFPGPQIRIIVPIKKIKS
jgi:hypothetical protein